MHSLIPALLLLITLVNSCKETVGDQPSVESPAGDSSETRRYDPKVQPQLQTRTCTEIDSSGIFMLPLSAGERSDGRKGDYYKEMPGNKYWNIIFYNSHTSGTHLLGPGKMLIDEYNCTPANYADERRSTSPRHIFYYITVLDHNGDKLLNNSDPQYLFATDKEGRQFRQLSPEGHDIRFWQYIKKSNKLLMLTVPDSDRNQEFNDEDEMTAFEIVLDTAAMPKEIISPEMKLQLKTLYDRDWKRVNQQ